jgi:hypothetical protein
MKLFLGNCTKRVHHFYYRIPGEPSRQMHERIMIQPGTQVQVPGDHTRVVLDALIEPYLKHGWKEAGAISSNHAYVGMCYSFDKPIRANVLNYQFEHNDAVLDEHAHEEMVKFASANAAAIRAQPYGEPQLQSMDVVVSDTPSPKDPNKTLTADGVSVTGEKPAPRKRARG